MSININQVTDNETPSTGLFTITGNLKVTGNIQQTSTGGAAICGKSSIAGPSTTITISTTAVLSTSLIFLTYTGGFIAGPNALQITGITSGTSFSVNGGNGVDGWGVAWHIINPV